MIDQPVTKYRLKQGFTMPQGKSAGNVRGKSKEGQQHTIGHQSHDIEREVFACWTDKIFRRPVRLAIEMFHGMAEIYKENLMNENHQISFMRCAFSKEVSGRQERIFHVKIGKRDN